MAQGPMFKAPKELEFVGNVAQKWRTFRREFEVFMCATGHDEKPDKRKVMCLLNIIGASGRAVYDTFVFDPPADNLKLVPVLAKFEGHCIPKQNEMLERHRFSERKQLKGESATQYVAALRKLAETCGFGELEDSVMRDQLVRGLSCDEQLTDKLYEEEDLTLEKALQICSTHEIRSKMSELSVQSKEIGVNALSQRGQERSWRGQSAHPQQRG